jgi:hypothetical protein
VKKWALGKLEVGKLEVGKLEVKIGGENWR